MIFPSKKVFHTENVENVENYVENSFENADFSMLGKKFQVSFPQFCENACGKVENSVLCAKCTTFPFITKNCKKMSGNKWRKVVIFLPCIFQNKKTEKSKRERNL